VRLTRIRLTLGQLVKLIALCALVLAMLRTSAAPWIVLLGAILPGFLIGRAKGGTGIEGGTLSGCLVSAGFGIVICAYFYLYPEPGVFLVGGPVFFIANLSVIGTISGALVSAALCGMIKMARPFYQKPLTDDACGRIVWRRLDDCREPRSFAWRSSRADEPPARLHSRPSG
jgi:hypothetical protein